MLHKTILVLTKKKSMFYVLMFEFMLLGVIGGLLGIFYRNCLKVEDLYLWLRVAIGSYIL